MPRAKGLQEEEIDEAEEEGGKEGILMEVEIETCFS